VGRGDRGRRFGQNLPTRAETGLREIGVDEPLDRIPVDLAPLRLSDNCTIMIETEPVQIAKR